MDPRGERESIRRVGLGLLKSPYHWDIASESTDMRTHSCELIQPGVGCDVALGNEGDRMPLMSVLFFLLSALTPEGNKYAPPQQRGL